MKLKNAATLLLAGGLAAGAYLPGQAQAKASYKIQFTKTAYVYTTKGKKTKTHYSKNKVATAYKTVKVKGKSYYDLGHGELVKTSDAKKYVVKKSAYKTSTQTKKIVRTIQLYKPNGDVTKKIQNAYVKRILKQNTKTKKKTYGNWSTSSWTTYTVPEEDGYEASQSTVASEDVFSTTKNKTVKVTYKEVKNTLTITAVNFNVTATGKDPDAFIGAYKLNSDQTLEDVESNVEVAQNVDLLDNTSKNYPWVYTVIEEGVDKKGTHFYHLQEDTEGATSVWVKASDFTKTTEANNVNAAARFQWTEKENRAVEQADLQLLNSYRAAVGVAPLTIAVDQQAATDARAQKGVEYRKATGQLSHNYAFGASENLAGGYISQKLSTQAFIDFTMSGIKDSWDTEKKTYDSHSTGKTGHYTTIINPMYTKVAISTVPYTNDKGYLCYFTVEEYFR